MTSYAVPPTRREAVVRRLRDEIVSGALPPGSVIKDAELASRLGVSITPVREAIAQLSAEGLIDLAPNRVRHVTALSQKSALDIVDTMAIMTTAAVERGVENLTQTHLETLRGLLATFAAGVRGGDMLVGLTAGAEFSSVLTRASGNRELQFLIDLVVSRYMRIAALSNDTRVWNLWLDGYADVLAHLENGDTRAAVARYAQIYVEYRLRAQELLFERQPDPGPSLPPPLL